MTHPYGTTILTKVFPGILDGNGNGVASGGPAVGEYWLPLTIRIATKTKTTPVANCTVFIGAPGVYDFTTYLDDTALGFSDTTSMCSGVIAQFGETITAQWTGGNPNDNVVLVVTGIVSNVPPSIGWLPQVPGTHFAGKLTPEISNTISFVPSNVTIGVAAGTGSVLTAGHSVNLVDDVRPYNSYYLKIYAASNGVATAFNLSALLINFYGALNTANGTILYQDEYVWWSDGIGGGAFGNTLGPIEIQDNLHGPYLNILYQNQAGSDQIQINYLLEYSTRRLNGPSVRQQSSAGGSTFGNGLDGLLADIVNRPMVAGAADVPLPLAYGTHECVFSNNGGNVETFNLNFGSATLGLGAGTNGFIGQLAVATQLGVNPRYQMTFPKIAGLLQVRGTGGDNFSFRCVSKFDRI